MKLNDFALRYLKGQKKHTIFTETAIVLSVALLTVLLSAVSIYRASAYNSAKVENGTYHILFNSLDKQSLLSIRNMDIFSETENYSVSAYTSSTDMDFGQLEKENMEIMYLSRHGLLMNDTFLRINADELTMLPEAMFAVKEGRLPEKDGEIVISDKSAYMWDYPAVGDTVSAQLIGCYAKGSAQTVIAESEEIPSQLTEKFDVAEVQTVEFTVVGISEEYNFVDYSDTRLKSYSYLTDNLLARFSDKANDLYWDLHDSFYAQGMEIDNFDYSMNGELLNSEGKGVEAKFYTAKLFIILYLCVIFIMFCERLVIDTAFEISAKERVKQFGLLKAVGASHKQIFAVTLWEAVYLAVPGSIVGTLAGLACSAGIFGIIKNAQLGDISAVLEFKISPYVYVTAVIAGILWVCISAVATGLRVIRATPVDAIRSAGRYDKVTVPSKMSGLAQGKSFTSAYASLSVGRNKKRFIVTMVSMVMSITLFTGFSYGIELVQDKSEKEFSYNRYPYDYEIAFSSLTPEGALYEVEQMKESGYFVNTGYDTFAALYAESDKLGLSPASSIYNSYCMIYLHPISRDMYESSITADNAQTYDSLLETGSMLICPDLYDKDGSITERVYDTIPTSITAARFFMQTGEFMPEETIPVGGSYTTDNRIYYSTGNLICAVIPEEIYLNRLYEIGADANTALYEAPDGVPQYVYSGNIIADAADGMEEQAQAYLSRHYYNMYSDNALDMERSASRIKVIELAGGFIIAVVALIAVVNIVNTISSNVQNRTSELAMLRACGMTRSRLYRVVVREGGLYAVTAGIISLVLVEGAILIIQLPFMTYTHDLTMEDLGLEFSYIIPIIYIAAATLAAFAVAAAATWLPVKKICAAPVAQQIDAVES